MEVQRLQATKDVPSTILVVCQLVRLLVGEDGVLNHLYLVVGGNEAGKIDTFRPASVVSSNRLQIVHVDDSNRNLPKAQGSDVESTAGAGRLDPGLDDLVSGLAVAHLAKGILLREAEVKGAIRWYKGGLVFERSSSHGGNQAGSRPFGGFGLRNLLT